ncbi:transcriptional regulator [Pectobacterium versatile]|uniref:winged helix-turn-helix domain-containing protein n=2 Tax=Pectobacterium versatile TaxID=2488639 RepID=UPI001CCD803E|nr:winged helix-turn-helix domain-containing protein [Pectobacterium versatile]
MKKYLMGLNMKDISMNDGSIYFLNFTFNMKMRVLQKDEEIFQLRKKEADVLALLCHKYPEPVSQDDFLVEVWRGGYVTSQSIAQVIRSLRCTLSDKNKNIIITIPKLGYQLATPPSFGMPDVDSSEIEQKNVTWENCESEASEDNPQSITDRNFLFTTMLPLFHNFFSKRKFFAKTALMVCSMAVFIASLIWGGLNAHGISLILGEERNAANIIWSENVLYDKTDDLFFCSKKDQKITCYSNEKN